MQCVAPERVATVRSRVLIEWPVLRKLCEKVICYAIEVVSILKNLIPVHILLHNFVTILFNIILPLKFMSVECYHYSELKRILITEKFF